MMAKRAFTLIELLIVVIIIGILTGIAIPQYKKYVDRMTAAEAIANIGSLMRAVNAYYQETGHYPYVGGGYFSGMFMTGPIFDGSWKMLSQSGLDIQFDENPSSNRKWDYGVTTEGTFCHGKGEYTVFAWPHKYANLYNATETPEGLKSFWHGHMNKGEPIGKIVNFPVPPSVSPTHIWSDHE